MLTRSSFRSSSRSSFKSYSSKPTVTVKRKSTWFNKKTEVKKVYVEKPYYKKGYWPSYTAPLVVGAGTSTVIHHYDDDNVPYQDNGMSGYGFMAFVLTLAVICAAGILLFRRFA